jgi:hypothetical protein
MHADFGMRSVLQDRRADVCGEGLVRFKLHELSELKEGIIRAFDQQGYWIEGGSLADI